MSTLKQRLSDDIKAAMLAHDAVRLDTLRGLKSAILYAEVAVGKREEGLTDQEIEAIFSKEAKKRQESADLYVQGGASDKAAKELAEKQIVEGYLPAQMSEAEIVELIDNAIAETGSVDVSMVGQIIGRVKQIAGSAADGAVIARIAKEKLS